MHATCARLHLIEQAAYKHALVLLAANSCILTAEVSPASLLEPAFGYASQAE